MPRKIAGQRLPPRTGSPPAGNPFRILEDQFFQDIDVTFTLSGEADNGLVFGATVDLDEVAGGAGGDTDDDFGYSVFISGGNATLTLGDTDGALDAALTEAGDILNPGSINDDSTSHWGYRGSYLDGTHDGQIARFSYAYDAFTGHLSVEMDDDDSGGMLDPVYAVGLSYERDYGNLNIRAGVGYQGESDYFVQNFEFVGSPFWTVGFLDSAEFGGSLSAIWTLQGSAVDTIGIGVQATRITGFPLEAYHHAIGFGLTSGPYSLHANYGIFDAELAALANDFFRSTGLGVSAGYDLGGGASVLAGYNSSTSELFGNPFVDIQQYSLGFSFSF
ncbi:porin [Gymnodinialimonas sp. 57CJ19]|uniref:porin n=1 Tax=Gymnodinialimonas sp. 57CJ19 TaxID=3138498 RepID=UPI00313454C4